MRDQEATLEEGGGTRYSNYRIIVSFGHNRGCHHHEQRRRKIVKVQQGAVPTWTPLLVMRFDSLQHHRYLWVPTNTRELQVHGNNIMPQGVVTPPKQYSRTYPVPNHMSLNQLNLHPQSPPLHRPSPNLSYPHPPPRRGTGMQSRRRPFSKGITVGQDRRFL